MFPVFTSIKQWHIRNDLIKLIVLLFCCQIMSFFQFILFARSFCWSARCLLHRALRQRRDHAMKIAQILSQCAPDPKVLVIRRKSHSVQLVLCGDLTAKRMKVCILYGVYSDNIPSKSVELISESRALKLE